MSPTPSVWQSERDRLVAKLADGKDPTGWPLSPEAVDNLKADIAECTRILRKRGIAVPGACPRCDGEGKVHFMNMYPEDYEPPATCSDCDGSGTRKANPS